MKYLDIENWKRKNHFLFFNDYEEPFWGLTVNLDISIALKKAKELNCSFFIYYLYKCIKAVNEIEAFRYRIVDNNKVVIHNEIHAAATINREDGTFGFSKIIYDQSIQIFIENAKKEIDFVRSSDELIPGTLADNVVHFSSLPWIQFTSLSHARKLKTKDSVPKISFGKIFSENEKKMLPVSIHVNHALLDGKDVADFLDLFQLYLNKE